MRQTEEPSFACGQLTLLADALETLNLHSRMLGRLNWRTPWGMKGISHLGWVHVLGGPCLVEVDTQTVSAAAGDLIVVFPGHEHCLRDSSHSPAVPTQDLLPSFHREGLEWPAPEANGASAFVISGCFRLEALERAPWPVHLPALIHVPGAGQRPLSYVEQILRLVSQELDGRRSGAELIVNRLVQVLLIKAAQEYSASRTDGDDGETPALGDPAISRAIALMHDQPAARWTVAALAEKMAISRSCFAARFTAVVGKPPLKYLSEWRMRKAAYLLRTTPAELKMVAATVGYESAAAFSKAFTRWAGVAPGVYRRSVPAAAASADVTAILPPPIAASVPARPALHSRLNGRAQLGQDTLQGL